MNSLANHSETKAENQMAYDDRAKELIAEFKKKVNTGKSSFDGFTLMFEGDYPFKIDDDMECNQQAANWYKKAKNWSNAGLAFYKAGKLAKKVSFDERYHAATNYANAASCFKKSGRHKYDEKSIFCLKSAIEIFMDINRLSNTAKYHKALAEIYEESEPPDIDRAVEHYEQAAKYFTNIYFADKCLLKVAQYSDNESDYQEAIQIYEKVACTSLENSLLKDSAKEYFLRAALCHLCVDMLNAEHALQRYVKIDPSFQDSQEYNLVNTLVRHIKEEDVDGFVETLEEHPNWHRFFPGYHLNVTEFCLELSGDSQVLSVVWSTL